jgi:hypothetical protein
VFSVKKKINYSDNLESLFVSGSIVLAQKKKNNGKLFSMRFLGGFAQFFFARSIMQQVI